MEILYREEQISQLASKLKLSKTAVASVLNEYYMHITSRLISGYTVKFLNVCYIKVNGAPMKERETLAYVATEVGRAVGVSSDVAYRVLTTFEEFMIRDLKKFYGYSIRGIVRIRLVQVSDTECRVRVKRSTRYSGHPITVTTLGSFRRRVETV